MGTRDARIDAYIAKSADFAKPILSSLRKTVQEACPEVEDDWKWRAPHFRYHGMLCGTPSHRREYLEWIGEAKSDETRRRRVETAVAWMAEGKSRNWKYER